MYYGFICRLPCQLIRHAYRSAHSVNHIAYTQHVTHNPPNEPLFDCLHFGQHVLVDRSLLSPLFSHALFGASFSGFAPTFESAICAFRILFEVNELFRFVVRSPMLTFFIFLIYLILRVRAAVRKLRNSCDSHILATHFQGSRNFLLLFSVRWTLQGKFIGREKIMGSLSNINSKIIKRLHCKVLRTDTNLYFPISKLNIS